MTYGWVLGTTGYYGLDGIGGQATSAQFNLIYGITGDKENRIYLSDSGKVFFLMFGYI